MFGVALPFPRCDSGEALRADLEFARGAADRLRRFVSVEGEGKMTLSNYDALLSANPLDKIEEVAFDRDWTFERAGEYELDLVLAGAWRDYTVLVNWCDDLEAVNVAAEIGLKAPFNKRAAIIDLIVMINQHLPLGHFNLCSEDGVVLFRYGLLLRGCPDATDDQCEELLKMALFACDQFYPAFQYVIWAGKSPGEALNAVLFDIQGEA